MNKQILRNYTLPWNENQQIHKNTQTVQHQHWNQERLTTTTNPNEQQKTETKDKTISMVYTNSTVNTAIWRTYMGKTGRKFSTRFKEHETSQRSKDD